MIEINTEPSAREIRQFGALWCVFFLGLAGLVLWRPAALLGAATVMTGAWVVSLIFNGEARGRQLLGVFLPGLLGGTGLAARFGVPVPALVGALAGVAVIGGALIGLAPNLGRRVYVGWMLAALPIGWTISNVVLGIVYYLVLTPTGLALRLFGRDPMTRKLDREAASYWVERPRRSDPRRDFKQF